MAVLGILIVLLMNSSGWLLVRSVCPSDVCKCSDKSAVCSGPAFDGNNIPSFANDLEDLTFQNIALNELPDYAFVNGTTSHHNLNKLKKLTIYNCTLRRISEHAFSGLESLNNLIIKNSQLTNEGFLANLTHTKIDLLELSGGLFETIPSFVLKDAPRIYDFVMENNRLKSIEIPDNNKFLEMLNLQGNNFGSLTPDTLKCTNNSIRNLLLCNCNITNIHRDAFSGFINLKTLDLSMNKIASENLTIALQGLGNNTKLETLHLNQMNIVHVTNDMFSSLTEIKELTLSQNGIEMIESEAFSQMTKLQKLYLDHNHLTSMAAAAAIPSIQELYLNFNNIKTLSALKLSTRNQLRVVDLSNNFVQKVSYQWIKDQTKMIKINLSHNHIGMLDQNSMKNVTSQKLDLSYNNIHSTTVNGIKAHTLDLSHNMIKHVTPSSMKSLYASLDDLDLSCNNITDIDANIFEDFYTMEKLNLSHNQMGRLFSDGYHLNVFTHLRHLRILDLSYNGISKFPKAQFIKNPHLTQLSLKGNLIQDMNNIPCEYLHESIQTLDMSYNRLQTIDRACIARMLLLKEVDFSENPFDCTCPLAEFMHWLQNDTFHAPINIVGISDIRHYHCYTPDRWMNKSLLEYHPVMGTCGFHPRNDSVNQTIIGISIAVVIVGIIILAAVLYFGKVCQKLRNLRYNWQIRYKEVHDGDMQVII